MARNDRIARLFKVLDYLARSKRGLPLRTLAERGGWKLRSLYRDIEALDKAGVPVVSVEGRYQLLDGWVPATQLGVDAEELLALFIARQQAAGWAGSRIGDALGRLYNKLAAPPHKSGELVPKGLGDGFTATPPTARDYTAHRKIVATLDRAVRERRVATVKYESVEGEVTQRTIEPAQLHWDPRLEALYVIAYCRLRKDIRIFATHRFKAVACRKETFAPRPEVTSAAALRHAFRIWRDDHLGRARLAFTGRSARLVAERRWHPTQRIQREPGRIVLEVEVAGFGELVPWVLSFGAECQVLEPQELAERVRSAHLEAANVAAPRRARGGKRPEEIIDRI